MIAGVLALAGLVASCALTALYLGCGGLCGEGGGCDIVRSSAFAELLGIQTPLFGVLFFVVALALALAGARRPLIAWSAVGAGAALVFIGIQAFVLHAFCAYCMVVDVAALALFPAAVWSPRLAPGRRGKIALVSAAVLSVGAIPISVSSCLESPAAAATPPPSGAPRTGVLTIVEYTDFECPFCRRLHETLKQLLPGYGDRVRVVRKHMPLASIHPRATDAAHAAICAEELGDGDRMADALFTAPVGELTPEGCARIAARLGLDLGRYRACVASDRPAKRVAADLAEAAAAGLKKSVPVLLVGGEKLRGAQPPELIKAAIERQLPR